MFDAFLRRFYFSHSRTANSVSQFFHAAKTTVVARRCAMASPRWRPAAAANSVVGAAAAAAAATMTAAVAILCVAAPCAVSELAARCKDALVT